MPLPAGFPFIDAAALLCTYGTTHHALIDRAALSADDVAWLDAYHAQVRISLSPDLQGQDLDWLTAATEPLGQV